MSCLRIYLTSRLRLSLFSLSFSPIFLYISWSHLSAQVYVTSPSTSLLSTSHFYVWSYTNIPLPDKLSLPAAARTAKYGLLFGLVYGGVQDAVGLARGRPVPYVEAVRRRFGSLPANQSQAS